jgi:hypothetical protein
LNYRLLPKLVPAAAAPRPRTGAVLGAVALVYAGLAIAYLRQIAGSP